MVGFSGASTATTGGATVAPAMTAVGVDPVFAVGEGAQEVRRTTKKSMILALPKSTGITPPLSCASGAVVAPSAKAGVVSRGAMDP